MLADLLVELKGQLVRRTQSGNASKLLDKLVATLQGGGVDVAPCRNHLRVSSDLDALVRDVHRLSDAVHDVIEERGSAVPAREMRLFTGWVAALAEEALRERNRRLGAMLDALPDHVILADVERNKVYANRAAREFPRASFDNSEVREQLERDFALALSGETVAAQVRIPSTDGPRWLEHTLSPVRAPDGDIEAIAISARDISARKSAEAQMEMMMGILGHDLRNPLAAVTGVSGLLLLQDLPEKARDGVQQIAHSARRMTEMIETLLDVTRSRMQGGLPIQRQDADLAAVTRAVVDELRAAHPGREIRLAGTGKVPGAWDAARMAEVVSNLVANALTHGFAHTAVEISISDGPQAVTLQVTNRGPVIPDASSLFEPFRRGDNGNGLGLGLFIAREVVKAHGGAIGVDSTEEKTSFTVTLLR